MVLVTGSSGMIGTALCESLSTDLTPYVGVDRNPNVWSTETQGKTLDVDLTKATPQEIVEKLPDGIKMMVHLAANARVVKLIQEPPLAIENCISVWTAYEVARLKGIKCVILASSREVYGNISEQLGLTSLSEDQAQHMNCESSYTASKIYAESLAQSYQRMYGIQTIILRFSNVYGRYDTTDRFIPQMISAFSEGKAVTVFGGKEKSMDFTFLDDTISGIRLVMAQFEHMSQSATGHCPAFNIAFGRATPLMTVANNIAQALGVLQPIIHEAENRNGELMYYQADLHAIQAFGWTPQFSIDEGIARTVQWYTDYFARMSKPLVT